MTQDKVLMSNWSVMVKTRDKYTCRECGSTENIQAHDLTGKHNDWRVGISLCGLCHSKKHPNLPVSLFLNKCSQPYWYNISASSLAKQFGSCSRTIIRRARKLGINKGILSDLNKDRLGFRVNNQQHKHTKPNKLRVDSKQHLTCERCGHEWWSRIDNPENCPRCHSPYWDKEKGGRPE